jgi:recombination protein RecA
MTLLTIEDVTRRGGTAAFINLESLITKETWVNWALKVAPNINLDKVLIEDADLGQESVDLFGKLIESNAFDVVVFDSVGAMGTDKELEVGNSKQAYGQSSMVTQMVKQAARFARRSECVPILINQIRDQQAGTFTLEKAPGGHAKDHFATLRVHLKPNKADFKNEQIKMDGFKIDAGYRVRAQLVKNKVGAPRRSAAWNYWNYETATHAYGFDRTQDIIDTALQMGVIEQTGAWFKHADFPGGKVQGKDGIKDFIDNNPKKIEGFRQQMVNAAYGTEGNIMEAAPANGVVTDAFDVVADPVLNEVENE